MMFYVCFMFYVVYLNVYLSVNAFNHDCPKYRYKGLFLTSNKENKHSLHVGAL